MEGIIKVKPYTKEKLDINENGNYYVLSFDNIVNLKVTDMAEFIISLFDGNKDIDEVLNILNKREIPLTKEDLNKFIDKFLIENNLIEGNELVQNNEGSRLWFHFPIIEGEKIKRFLNLFKYLFYKKVLVLQYLFFIFIQIIFFMIGKYSSEIDKIWSNNTLVVLILLLISSLFHEVGHASATNYYDCKVGSIGVGLYLFKPVLYADLSSTWKLDRKKRVLIDTAGIYFQIVVCNILSIILLFYDKSELKVSILSIVVLGLLNLNPFLRLDGYWVLTDWIGLVNVNNRVFNLIKYKIKKYILRRDCDEEKLDLKTSARIILYVYMMIYFIFTVVALCFGFYMIFKLVTGEINIGAMFLNLFDAIRGEDLGLFFGAFNKLIVNLLPYIYILLMIYSTVKKSFNKNRYKKEGEKR